MKKNPKRNRLYVCLLLSSLLSLSPDAYGQNRTINLNLSNVSLNTVLKEIEKQTSMSIVYNSADINTARAVNFVAANEPLESALKKLLTGMNAHYSVVDNHIVISSSPDTSVRNSKNTTIPLQGTIVDEHGEPLVGVSVVVKGTTNGTMTDIDGKFQLQVPSGSVIEVTYLGYTSQTIKIGSSTPKNLDIILKEEEQSLDEVVVTALGIKRAEKALSYNVQQIKGEQITAVKDANFMNALTGKVAGVTINASSAGIGGATRVVMRGPKSINYNNNALYVIDGVPMTNEGGEVNGVFASNTSSDNISSINPDDIESLSVLTGAAASSLYGSLGQNGVIIITTKSGASGKPKLTYSNSTSFFSPFVMPKFQNTYGTSEDGAFDGWGMKLEQPSSYKPKDFFQRGYSTTHSLTLTFGTDKNQSYISAAALQADGIIPSNEITRYNFTFKNNAKMLNDKLSIGYNMMYMHQKEKNMFAQGLYNNPIVPVYLFPPGGNWDAIKSFERFDGSRNFPTQYWPYADDQFRMQNPYWITNRLRFQNTYSRLLIGANAKWDVASWISVEGRAKMEKNDTSPETNYSASSKELFSGAGGRFYRGKSTKEQLYFDLLVNMKTDIGENFSVLGNAGYSRTETKSSGISVDSWIPMGAIPNLFNTGNSLGTASSFLPYKTSFQALFANGEIAWKETLYLNASVRSDWWSQLSGTDKLYIIYPSFGVSAILSNLIYVNPQILSFAKVRANYTNVGNPPPAYVTGEQTYPVSGGSPDFGNGIKPSKKLQPERTKGYEIGLNLKLLQNKFNLDLTLYDTDTYNQIFNVPISSSSFYSSFFINAGKVNNKGIEAALGFNTHIGKVKWESNATYTLNRNKVVKLIKDYYDETSNQYITRDLIEKGGSGSYSMKVKVGGSLSDVYTTTLQLDDQDKYVVVRGGKVSADNKNFVFAGRATPDYNIGFRNSFSWNNFDVNFSINGRFGGVVVSATQAMLDAFGVSQESANARERGYVMVNGYPLPSVQDYYTVMGNGLNGVLSEYVYSATNIRLQDLSIGYTIPQKWLNNYVKNVHLALTGRNLWMIYNKAPFDPESTASTGTYYQGFDFFMQPSLQSLGFNVKVQF